MAPLVWVQPGHGTILPEDAEPALLRDDAKLPKGPDAFMWP